PSPGISVGKDEPLVLDHLKKDASVGKLIPFGIAHDNQAGTARPDVELGGGGRPGQRSEPLREQGGVCPCPEQRLPRRIDQAGQHQLAIGGRGGIGGGGHSSFSCFAHV